MSKMQKFCFLLLFGLFAVIYSEEERDIKTVKFEIGVVFGEPNGLSLKYWFSKHTAADLGAAWSFSDEGSFSIYLDFLVHLMEITLKRGTMPLYIGVGPQIKIDGTDIFGLRAPFGVEYIFRKIPLSVFLEGGPRLELSNRSRWKGFFGGGIRLAI